MISLFKVRFIKCIFFSIFLKLSFFFILGFSSPDSNSEDEHLELSDLFLDNLLNGKSILNEMKTTFNEEHGLEYDVDLLYGYQDGQILEPSLESINKTFNDLFTQPRSHNYNETMKENIRQEIVQKFLYFGLKLFKQKFTARSRFNNLTYVGSNIIAMLPGQNRGHKDELISVIGAHYDTVKTCPGVDDNGSGCVALLETARILSGSKTKLNRTIYFVMFDLEEMVRIIKKKNDFLCF